MKEEKIKFEIVVSSVIERDGKFLLVQEKKHPEREEDPHAGKWNLPGGSLELNEDLLKCAEREVKEETTAISRPTHQILTESVVNSLKNPEFCLLSIVFKSKITEGEPKATEDVKAVSWFSLDQIREMNQNNELKGSPHSYVVSYIEDCLARKTISIDEIKINLIRVP